MEISANRVSIQEKAIANVRDIVSIAVQHSDSHKALIVYDTDTELAQIIEKAYRIVLPNAEYIDFNKVEKEEIISAFDTLSPRDLVVLIQSTDFRLNEFRIRIYLFQKKLKVIDHQHLYRNTPDSWETYIDALAYDPDWYRRVGPALKKKLELTNELLIEYENYSLIVNGGLEIPKLNIGDYTGMENIGGTFPIGEVFTEAKNLEKMNGSLMIYAFAGTDYNITIQEPFRISIENGLLVGWSHNAPEAFVQVVTQIKATERPLVREIGFGLNRAITREKYLKDITAFERTLGMHFSLGEKHTVYKKQGITADKTRFHVDLFPAVESVNADGTCIFENGIYHV